LLNDLAALVTQAKKASHPDCLSDPIRLQAEVERMLRLGGQVFSLVRRFLAIAIQCGIELPQPRMSTGSMYDSVLSPRSDNDENVPPDQSPGDDTTATVGRPVVQTTNGIVQRQQTRRQRDTPGTPGAALRVRSMGDLKAARLASVAKSNVPALPTNRHLTNNGQRIPSAPLQRPMGAGHKHDISISSISSTSSASSFSSADTADTPATPPFPSGPSSVSEIMEVLRHTHDQYLSTIAAFVGHAHSHSRSSHASSTGHMYELAHEIVEMVCKLLTIVEAVMRHPDMSAHNLANLRAAKDGLYSVTSSFAESVQHLTVDLPPAMTEEDEKAALLRSATSALKAGADCVAAVKLCMNRNVSEKPFIVQLPKTEEGDTMPFTPSKFSRQKTGRTSSAGALHALYKAQGVEDDEDMTIQAQTPSSIMAPLNGRSLPSSRPTPPPKLPFVSSSIIQAGSEIPPTPSIVEDKPLPPLLVTHAEEPVEPPLQSPVLSVARTEDDRTTWEGSQRHHEQEAAAALEEKLIRGELPSIPGGDFMGQDPVTWMLSQDYAMEDVAYNTEGLLVGATLPAIVGKMTPHDSLVDIMFSSVFFLTFRLFASPAELVQALIARYNIAPPRGLSQEDLYIWQQRKGVPVRLRVSNFIKAWLEVHWRPASDNVVIPVLSDFTQNALAVMFPGPSQRIMELIATRSRTNDVMTSPKGTRRDAGMPISPPSGPPSEIPRPLMTKTLLASLRARNFGNITITDFDPLELGRQMTIMECDLFCSIVPDDLLEIGQEGSKAPVNVKSVTQLSTVITGWVTESILNELDTKKRATLVKFFIKLADVSVLLPRTMLAWF
jgi:son of sevenless